MLRMALLCSEIWQAAPDAQAPSRHLQCFDLGMFLEYARKHSAWLCPCCHKPLVPKDMHVDALFAEVLKGVSSDADKCRIFPDGNFEEVRPKPAAEVAAAATERASKRARGEQHVGAGWAGGGAGSSRAGNGDGGLALLADAADGGAGAAASGIGGSGQAWSWRDALNLGRSPPPACQRLLLPSILGCTARGGLAQGPQQPLLQACRRSLCCMPALHSSQVTCSCLGLPVERERGP